VEQEKEGDAAQGVVLRQSKRCRSSTAGATIFFEPSTALSSPSKRRRRRRAPVLMSLTGVFLVSITCFCSFVFFQRGVTPVDGLASRSSSSSSSSSSSPRNRRQPSGNRNNNKPPQPPAAAAAAALSNVDQETNDKVSLFLSQQQQQQQQDPSSFTTTTDESPSASLDSSSAFEIMREQFFSNQTSIILSESERDALLVDCVVTSTKDQWREVLQWMMNNNNNNNNILSKTTYDAALQACFEHSFATRAVDLLTAMRRRASSNNNNNDDELEPDANDYALCILALCRKDVQQDHPPSNHNSNNNASLWRQALALQQEFVDHNKQYDDDCTTDLPIATYDAILTCMVQEKAWKEAVRLLRFLEQPPPTPFHNKTQPSLSTYRTVIECCVAAHQAEPALQVLQSCITTSNLSPTTYSFELVIVALCRIRQWRRARHLLDQMEALGVPRNLPMYHALLQASSRAKEVAAAKQLLVRLERREPPSLVPTTLCYNAVLSVCAATSHWRDALQLLDQLHRKPGVEPDVYSYTK